MLGVLMLVLVVLAPLIVVLAQSDAVGCQQVPSVQHTKRECASTGVRAPIVEEPEGRLNNLGSA